jgi:hypothetical protein
MRVVRSAKPVTEQKLVLPAQETQVETPLTVMLMSSE